MSADIDRDAIQQAIGDAYTLEDEIGRGGMGIVYRAHDRRLDRSVAIKVLREEIGTSVGAARFQQEIRIEARLQHPNIVPVLEWAQRGRHTFCVMPFIAGEPLRERLRRERQLPVADALRIAREIGSALAYAHAAGVVHRDVKPENILLSSGHAMLTDFGIARILGEAAERLTDSGFAVGTVAYMSPEQASADSEVGVRSDIYSLGCVLYEMLAGAPPFVAATPQIVIARHMSDRPPALSIVRPSVPPHIVAVIERAMEKVPADRFSTAAEFAAALDISTGTSPAQTSSNGATAQPTSRPSRLRLAVGAIGMLSIATIGGVWWTGRTPPLDSNRVVVLPLQSNGAAADMAALGWDVAIAIGTSLENAEPLRVIDGYSHLDVDTRSDLRRLTARAARQLTRERGARHYLDGAIVRRGDSTEVTLRLYDAQGDSLVAQESAAGDASVPVPTLGLRAMARVLPRLLDPTRRIDMGDLAQRSPSAVALWIQGEREYRQSRFAPALELFRRAVQADSALAIAAIRGAQAASWELELEEAESLAALAVARQRDLPARYGSFANGLLLYLQGNADSSRIILERLVTTDRDGAEVAMALAEVQLHLLTGVAAPPDSATEYWLNEAIRRDSSFTPPFIHLAEIALRRGAHQRAEQMLRVLRARGGGTGFLRELDLMSTCVRGDRPSWSDAVRVDAKAVLAASRALLANFAQPACAEAGLRALLQSPETSSGIRWSALLHLQSMLVATRRDAELRQLLDSTVAAGTSQARALYVIDAIAGADTALMAPKANEAAAFAQKAYGPVYAGASPQTRWVLGLWHAQQGDTARLRAMSAVSDSVALRGGRREQLFALAMRAHLRLALGDSTGSIAALRQLTPSARRDSLSYELFEPLGVERAVLASLLLARGDATEAARAATHLDHFQPAIYLAFLPRSLQLRIRAAEQLDKPSEAEQDRQRLRAIERFRNGRN